MNTCTVHCNPEFDEHSEECIKSLPIDKIIHVDMVFHVTSFGSISARDIAICLAETEIGHNLAENIQMELNAAYKKSVQKISYCGIIEGGNENG